MLPSFNINRVNLYNNPKLMKDLEIEMDDTSYAICKLFQNSEMHFGFESSENDFKYNPSEEDIVIEKDFILAIINLEILTDLNLPFISVSVINRKDFI